MAYLEDTGWVYESSEVYNIGNFSSWRKGQLNIIMTTSKEWFDKFLLASAICQNRTIKRKEERIQIFDQVLNQKNRKEKNRGTKDFYSSYLNSSSGSNLTVSSFSWLKSGEVGTW